MRLLIEKIVRRARAVSSPELRRHGRFRGSHAPKPPASPVEVREIEVDAESGLKLITVAGVPYWQPLSMDCRALADIHAEVFDPTHPHYYEDQDCRIHPNDVVIDAGASEGFFTRFALDRGARVVAVEPWCVQAQALRRTYAREIDEGRVIVVEAALSDREGEATLEIDPTAPWGATVGRAYRATERRTVAVTTLDALVGRTWGRCDFLKADVEGMEHHLVRGAFQTLSRDKPRVAIAVYHGDTNYLDVRNVLRATRAGYTVTGKGHFRHRFVTVPVLLHAWVS